MDTKQLSTALDALKIVGNDNSFESKVIVLESSEGNLRLIVSSPISYGYFDVPCDLKWIGTCAVDINLFQKIVKSCLNKEINIVLEENNNLLITFGEAKFTLHCIDFTKQIINQKFETENDFNAPFFSKNLSKLASFCDPTSTFVQMKGIYAYGDKCFFISRAQVNVFNRNPFMQNIFINSNFFDFIKLLRNTVKIAINKEFLKIFYSNFEFLFPIKREFEMPEVDRYLKMEPNKSLIFNIDDINGILGSISVINPSKISLELENNDFKLTGSDGIKSEFEVILKSQSSSQNALLKDKYKINLDFPRFRQACRILEEKEVKIDIFEKKDVNPFRISDSEITQILSSIN